MNMIRFFLYSARSLWVGSTNDTIYATATSQSAKAALAIVRVDGPQADRLAQLIAPPKNNHITILEPRRVYRRKLISPFANDHQIIDPEAVLIRFHHPNHAASTIEFHLHGSTAVLKALLNTLSKLDFLRLAQPGEFTRRRFLRANGSMDINKVLGLKHLIDAETEEQRKWAVAEFNASSSFPIAADNNWVVLILNNHSTI